MTGRPWTVADAAMCGAVFLAGFLYRFNTLGGTFGGFSNDEFGYLARARQIQAGEVPFRDFNDPGWFLTDYLSAAAQWVGGYNLRSQALLTVGMLSLAATLTFLLARRASGSLAAGLVAAGLQIGLEPRHYNYPKLVLYAAGLALAWAYADRPGRARAAALGGMVGIAFLFRHDHVVYLGALAVMTLALVHRGSLRTALRDALPLTAAAAASIVPFLLFLALNGGVGEYFRLAWVYVQRDAQRTSFALPRFELDAGRPLVAISGGAEERPAVNVRWRNANDDERLDREGRYRLTDGAQVEGTTWRYRLADTSRTNIESLVRDPLVEDTAGIDRTRFAAVPTPRRLQTPFDASDNAVAFLYYAFVALPALGAIALWRLHRARQPSRASASLPHLVPLLALSALLSAGFLSRGSTDVRIADVGVTSAVILGWLLSVGFGRDLRLVASSGAARIVLRSGLALLLCATMLSVEGLARTSEKIRDGGWSRGPAVVAERSAGAWRALGTPPARVAEDMDQPRVLGLAAWARACTAPDDRLFVLGVYPEIYYFADRRFAGGHAWLLPHYYSGSPEEGRIVARLQAARVPVVITESRSVYDAEYRPVFTRVTAYLDAAYEEAGEVDVGEQRLRVLVRTDLEARGRYEPLALPCFVSADGRRG